ncbi:hypothetical protein SUGI_0645070 [Cryptomeria japonica]|uniref:uncharacterized protein LOC131073007 n=1 Tax=Cryptomeria japonica TaxID=3369 RepID=UPI0024148B61|nr:uncharacterized protein LOC131073007 [Cryptomeria japonica]GLJ32030.1 hypothetical protein SUGI_0645070 [Cryptomeria japonica]
MEKEVAERGFSFDIDRMENAIMECARMEKEDKALSVLKERNIENQNHKKISPVKVPLNNFSGFCERYKSPTDSLLSPVSTGLLARNEKAPKHVPLGAPTKVLDDKFQEVRC